MNSSSTKRRRLTDAIGTETSTTSDQAVDDISCTRARRHIYMDKAVHTYTQSKCVSINIVSGVCATLAST